MNPNLDALLRHMHEALALSFAPAFLIACATGLLCGVFGRSAFVLAGFGFGLFGAAIGLMLGASRDPAVTAVAPALVTLAGGLAAYLFPASRAGTSLLGDVADEAERARFTRGFVLTAISAISISAATGAGFGSAMRGETEAFLREFERNRMLYEQVQIPIERALLERALGLETRAPEGAAPVAEPQAD